MKLNKAMLCRSPLVATVVLLAACGGDGGESPMADDENASAVFEKGGQRVVSSTATYSDGREITVTMQYDQYGLLTAQQAALPGRSNVSIKFDYDNKGQLIKRSQDANADATDDNIRLSRYNTSGIREATLIDNDADGDVELVIQFFIDDDNLIRNSETRLQAQGIAAVDVQPGQGILQSRTKFEYEAGRLTQRLFDSDLDGNYEDIRDYQYDTEGHLTSIMSTRTDKQATFIDSYTYETGICNKSWLNSTEQYFCVD